jgi:aspartate beta-hydroxylase
MSPLPTPPELSAQLARAQGLMASGQALQAEMTSLKLLERWPGCIPALAIVAECATLREDHGRAAEHWQRAWQADPSDQGLLFRRCVALVNQGDQAGAEAALLQHQRTAAVLAPECWLLLGHVKHQAGQGLLALKAFFHAIDGAQRQGRWLNEATTPPELLGMVLSAMQVLAPGKRDLLQACLAPVRSEVGSQALQRVDRAMANYLGQTRDGPTDPRQRPKFLYIPGLPDAPYHDPYLQPWAKQLAEAFPVMRQEALSLLNEQGVFESFLTFGPGAKRADYVSGDGAAPSWDAALR